MGPRSRHIRCSFHPIVEHGAQLEGSGWVDLYLRAEGPIRPGYLHRRSGYLPGVSLHEKREHTVSNKEETKRIPERVLIGKVGLDGHDRGAKYVAHILRDAGYEVIYTGIRRTPKQIVETAIQEDVAVIGLSLLSGAHKRLLKQVIELLKDRGALDIVVVAGGAIPASDIPVLKGMGIAEVFTSGVSSQSILEAIASLLKNRRKAA